MKRRHFILLLGGGSSGALSVGTGAFSSASAERDVEVNVVDDENAYLGLEVKTRTVTVGQSTEVVEITNRFAETESLSLDVSVESTSDTVGEVAVADQDPGQEFSLEIGPGESEPVAIKCTKPESASFELQFVGEVGGDSVEMTRTFDDIDCESRSRQSTSGITFKSGKSGIVINRDEATGATVYYEEGSGLGEARSDDVSVNETLKLKQDFDGPNNGGEIVAAAVDGVEGIYVHSAFDEDDCEIPGTGKSETVTTTQHSDYLDECIN